MALRSGAMTAAQFAAATTPDALAAALAKTQLPGRVAAPGTPLPTPALLGQLFRVKGLQSTGAAAKVI